MGPLPESEESESLHLMSKDHHDPDMCSWSAVSPAALQMVLMQFNF